MFHTWAIAILWLGMLQDADRFPVPDRATQKDSSKRIKDIFRDDFAVKTPEGRLALLEKLVKAADEVPDRAMRYSLLLEARDIAAGIPDVKTAVRLAHQLAASFEVDGDQVVVEILPTARKAATTPDTLRALTTQYLRVARQSIAGEQFEATKAFAKEALRTGKATRNQAAAKAAAELAALAVAKQKEKKKVVDAYEELSKSNDNASANLTVGRYLAFSKGDWSQAVVHLAKGSDRSLKKLAAMEIGADESLSIQVELGDAWSDTAKGKGKATSAYIQRGRYWYEKALTQATTLQAPEIARAIARLDKQKAKPAEVDLLSLVDPSEATDRPWRFEDDVLIGAGGVGVPNCLEIPYVPPHDYNITVVVRRTEGRGPFGLGLVGGSKHQLLASVNGFLGGGSSIRDIDTTKGDSQGASYTKELLLPNKDHTIVYSVRQSSVSITVNDKTIINWKAAWEAVSLPRGWKSPGNESLFLGAEVSGWRVMSVRLTPLSGNGHWAYR